MTHAARYLSIGIIFLSSAWPALAQDACDPDQTISHAESEFHAGHFYSIPAILQKCLSESNFSQEQSLRAYLLLCQVYLVIDDPIAAEDSYLKLLKADPEFVPNEKDDPIDIVYLSKKFTATPIFTPHVRVGPNISFFQSVYPVSTEPFSVESDQSSRIGLQVGAGIDWNLDDNFSLCLEGDFSTRGYSRVLKNMPGGDDASIIASQTWVDIPLYFKYSKSTGNIRPFGYIGYAVNFLFSAQNEFNFIDNKPDGSQLVTTGPNEVVTYQRNFLNRSWLVGGGIKYKIGRDFLYADLRYMGGLTDLANQDRIYYQDPNTIDPNQIIGNRDFYLASSIARYRYISDLFRLDNLSLSFGFIRPIYDPRRVKKAKTKGVLRMIRKDQGGTKK